MTVEEFAAMITAETEDYELVEGELVPLSSGNPIHARVRDHVVHRLWSYFELNPGGVALGEIDCRLASHTVRRPDVAIFTGARMMRIEPLKIPIPFAPDIAVEILSPSERKGAASRTTRDSSNTSRRTVLRGVTGEIAVKVRRKALEYLAAGSHEVWQLDYENGEVFVQTNTGMRLLRGQDALETPLLPGFSVIAAVLLAGF